MWRGVVLACLGLVALARDGAAQTSLVINFPAGGATDIVGRLIQNELASGLGTPLVIRNVGGASGTIGAAEVARGRPDGSTFLLTPTGPIAIQPAFMRNLAYRADSFAPVCQVSDAPVVMMTPSGSGLMTLVDVLARARAADGAMPYASSGIATVPHIVMVAFLRSAGTRMNHIPFRGSGDAVLAMQQGSVLLFSDQSVLVRQYDLHPIAVFTEARLVDYPTTPTMRELGHDLVFSIWSGIYAPLGTPEAALARMELACERAMRTETVIAGMARLAQPIRYRNRTEFAAFTREEAEKYRGLIAAVGMRQAD